MVTVLTLRSPENAARAMEGGYGTLAIESMQRFPSSGQTQKQACLMIRNLVVRNPENRYAVNIHIFLFDVITCQESVWLTMRSLDGIPVSFAINAIKFIDTLHP